MQQQLNDKVPWQKNLKIIQRPSPRVSEFEEMHSKESNTRADPIPSPNQSPSRSTYASECGGQRPDMSPSALTSNRITITEGDKDTITWPQEDQRSS